MRGELHRFWLGSQEIFDLQQEGIRGSFSGREPQFEIDPMGEAAIGEVKAESDCVVLMLLDVACQMIELFWLKFDNRNMDEVDFLVVKGVGDVLLDYSHISSRVRDVLGLH